MRKIICINQDWRFKKGVTEEAITLPHTWNAEDGQDGGNDYHRGVGVYTKMIAHTRNADEEVYLEFRGINSSAEVKVNEQFCGSHAGGYSTFRVNINLGRYAYQHVYMIHTSSGFDYFYTFSFA